MATRAPRLQVPLDPVPVDETTGGSFEVEVFNTSDIVDELIIEVNGLDERHVDVTVTPATLSLFPSDSGTVQITIRARRPYSLSAGIHEISVQARPTQRGDDIGTDRTVHDLRVAEMTIDVAPITQVNLEMHPKSVKGGSSTALVVLARNMGNRHLNLTLRGQDPEGAVRFSFDQEVVTLPPGEEGWTAVEVSARRPFKGQSLDRQLTVTGHLPESEEPEASTQATFSQKAVLPGFAGTLILLVVAAVLIIGAYLLITMLVDRMNEPDISVEQAGAIGEEVGKQEGATAGGAAGAEAGQEAGAISGGFAAAELAVPIGLDEATAAAIGRSAGAVEGRKAGELEGMKAGEETGAVAGRQAAEELATKLGTDTTEEEVKAAAIGAAQLVGAAAGAAAGQAAGRSAGVVTAMEKIQEVLGTTKNDGLAKKAVAGLDTKIFEILELVPDVVRGLVLGIENTGSDGTVKEDLRYPFTCPTEIEKIAVPSENPDLAEQFQLISCGAGFVAGAKIGAFENVRDVEQQPDDQKKARTEAIIEEITPFVDHLIELNRGVIDESDSASNEASVLEAAAIEASVQSVVNILASFNQPSGSKDPDEQDRDFSQELLGLFTENPDQLVTAGMASLLGERAAKRAAQVINSGAFIEKTTNAKFKNEVSIAGLDRGKLKLQLGDSYEEVIGLVEAAHRGKAVGEVAGEIVLSLFIESCFLAKANGTVPEEAEEEDACAAFQSGIPEKAFLTKFELRVAEHVESYPEDPGITEITTDLSDDKVTAALGVGGEGEDAGEAAGKIEGASTALSLLARMASTNGDSPIPDFRTSMGSSIGEIPGGSAGKIAGRLAAIVAAVTNFDIKAAAAAAGAEAGKAAAEKNFNELGNQGSPNAGSSQATSAGMAAGNRSGKEAGGLAGIIAGAEVGGLVGEDLKQPPIPLFNALGRAKGMLAGFTAGARFGAEEGESKGLDAAAKKSDELKSLLAAVGPEAAASIGNVVGEAAGKEAGRLAGSEIGYLQGAAEGAASALSELANLVPRAIAEANQTLSDVGGHSFTAIHEAAEKGRKLGGRLGSIQGAKIGAEMASEFGIDPDEGARIGAEIGQVVGRHTGEAIAAISAAGQGPYEIFALAELNTDKPDVLALKSFSSIEQAVKAAVRLAARKAVRDLGELNNPTSALAAATKAAADAGSSAGAEAGAAAGAAAGEAAGIGADVGAALGRAAGARAGLVAGAKAAAGAPSSNSTDVKVEAVRLASAAGAEAAAQAAANFIKEITDKYGPLAVDKYALPGDVSIPIPFAGSLDIFPIPGLPKDLLTFVNQPSVTGAVAGAIAGAKAGVVAGARAGRAIGGPKGEAAGADAGKTAGAEVGSKLGAIVGWVAGASGAASVGRATGRAAGAAAGAAAASQLR